MTPLPQKPIFDPAKPALYYIHAAKFYNALRRAGLSIPNAIGFVANADLESAFRSNVVGDKGTAYGICQWHFEPRGAAILAATGIDVRVESDFDRIVQAIMWELVGSNGNPGVESHAYAEITACDTSASSAAAVCAYFEGAGAAEAEERRMADGNFWSAFVGHNFAWVQAQG